VTQHASLTAERWSRFSLDQQVLMIANEMHRATALLEAEDRISLERAYERVLRLLDLTVAVQRRRTLRRELLRWRDLVAALFIGSDEAPADHREALRALLLLRPAAARQIPLLLG
jgi:pantothenate kinase